MRKISLVLKALVDAGGWRVRLEADCKALGIADNERKMPPRGFVDLGLVEHEGQEFYLSMLKRPEKKNG